MKSTILHALLVHVTMQIFVVAVVVFVVSCNWFFPANHKSVLVLFLFTCILYCIAFLLLREAFLRMRIPSIYHWLVQSLLNMIPTAHFALSSYFHCTHVMEHF